MCFCFVVFLFFRFSFLCVFPYFVFNLVLLCKHKEKLKTTFTHKKKHKLKKKQKTQTNKTQITQKLKKQKNTQQKANPKNTARSVLYSCHYETLARDRTRCGRIRSQSNSVRQMCGTAKGQRGIMAACCVKDQGCSSRMIY